MSLVLRFEVSENLLKPIEISDLCVVVFGFESVAEKSHVFAFRVSHGLRGKPER